jgi:hypothetical protein
LEAKPVKAFATMDLDCLRLDVVSAFSPIDFDRWRFVMNFLSIPVAVLL